MTLTFNFNSFKRIAFSFLALLLCFILVINPLRVSAVAGVDDALFWLLVAVLASSGVTFSSVADAHVGCDALWNNFDTATQDLFLQKVDTIIGASGIASTTTIGMNFLIDQWTSIIQGITSTFGNYTGTDAVVNVEHSGILTADNPMLTFDVTYNPSSYIVYKVSDNLSVSLIGTSSDGTVPAYLNVDMSVPSCVCHYVNVAGVFSGGQRLYVSAPSVTNKYNISLSYALNDIVFNSPQSRGIFQYYQGQPLKFNYLSKGFTMTVDGVNIVRNGYLMNTSIPVPGSICPDGVWNSTEDYMNWLNDLIFGNNNDIALGNPGIDVTAYPGNDVWHDGSIRDDVDVGSPSIGISVPLGDDVVGNLTPELARDYENTDVKEKDIADVKPDEDTDNPTNDKPSKVVPALSLPEVLFQHKFPFCLPYDVYAMCLGLRSDNAEPPIFSIPYKNDTLNINLEYEINFEDFNEVIIILRFFIGASFTIGLIFATRKLIWK